MDTSVTHHRLALEEAEMADRPLHANGLASALFERYQETWDRRDLRSAVRLWRRAESINDHEVLEITHRQDLAARDDRGNHHGVLPKLELSTVTFRPPTIKVS
jgi:hypothetical protein